jgi:hypothetical protein
VTVTITVNAVDDGPEVVVSPGGSCGEDTNGSINLTVSDSDTPPGNLTLSSSSSNTALVPNANVVFGGSGANQDDDSHRSAASYDSELDYNDHSQ